MISGTWTNIPISIKEFILLQTIKDAVNEQVVQNQSAKERPPVLTLIKTVSTQLESLKNIDRMSYTICASERFTRLLIACMFPIAVSSRCKIQSNQIWNMELRNDINVLCRNSWLFLWRAMKKLRYETDKGKNTDGIRLVQLDHVVLWLNPNDTEKGNTNNAVSMKIHSNTDLMISTSAAEWILLKMPTVRFVTRPQRSRSLEFTLKQDKDLNMSIKKGFMTRSFCFEDMITLSSRFNSLHYIDDMKNPQTLTYSDCKICSQHYPKCGNVKQQVCGSCLYSMNMSLSQL